MIDDDNGFGHTQDLSPGHSQPDLRTGSLIAGKYEVLGELGSGGMGVVYRVRHVTLGTQWAIKVLHPSVAGSATDRKRFEREAHVMAQLDHPGILKVDDVERDPNNLIWLRMPLIGPGDSASSQPGSATMERLLGGPGRLLPEPEVARLLRLILEALDYAHGRGVIHRDLKPANILLDGRTPKISDFGLVMLGGEEWLATRLRQSRSEGSVGSVHYMDPQQLLMGESADARSDLYALGRIGFQLLSGGRFPSLYKPPTISEHRPDIASWWDGWLRKALEEERDDRFQSAAAMLAAMAEETPEPATHRPPSSAHACEPAPPPPAKKTASKAQPFENSLGMRFVPVPINGGPTWGKDILFSVWQTRRIDYEAYAKENPSVDGEWRTAAGNKSLLHPVVNVNWDEAKAFCTWLTEKERRAGIIGANDAYRLPSDHEWSCAVGIGESEDPAASPESKSGEIETYPWGSAWPPPKDAGNYSNSIEGYESPYKRTAPVGSFQPNQHGLCDLSGNAWEWCEDWYSSDEKYRVLRGGSWLLNSEINLRSSYRYCYTPRSRDDDYGFRCVLEVSGG